MIEPEYVARLAKVESKSDVFANELDNQRSDLTKVENTIFGNKGLVAQVASVEASVASNTKSLDRLTRVCYSILGSVIVAIILQVFRG